jgi:hypothetical protein
MWKKQLYKRVFDRLHNENWECKKPRSNSMDGNGGGRTGNLASSGSPYRRKKGNVADDNIDSDPGSGDEEVFDDAYVQREMGDMIHRAAQWLTALDNAGRSSRGRGGRGGRGYPGRTPPSAGRGTGLPKRARLS